MCQYQTHKADVYVSICIYTFKWVTAFCVVSIVEYMRHMCGCQCMCQYIYACTYINLPIWNTQADVYAAICIYTFKWVTACCVVWILENVCMCQHIYACTYVNVSIWNTQGRCICINVYIYFQVGHCILHCLNRRKYKTYVWVSMYSQDTGWRRPIGCLKLQVIFRKRATNYRALLRKMTDKR